MATSKGLDADLALVTACRDDLERLSKLVGNRLWFAITYAALSLIEDTLNRHAPDNDAAYIEPNGGGWFAPCYSCEDDWPCADYNDHRAALRTIATALGIDPEPRTDHQ